MKKKLVVFCDGTWNRADQARDGDPCPTNVVKLALRLARQGDGRHQLVYYGQGVGTGGSVDKITGGAFGEGLLDNLHAAYRFIVLNYEPGDELYLFGFSRGAYTARSLAGMIRKCGILGLKHARNYGSAVKLYCDDAHPDADGPLAFRRSFCVCEGERIKVRFLGVWDTVGALGIPVRGLRSLTAHKYRFHDVELSSSVESAYQALAIDERRAPFEAARWAYVPKPGQKVVQTWFVGAHSDIGGGYPPSESGLSDIAMQWMQENAQSEGLAIDEGVAAAYPYRPDPTAPIHDSKTGLYRLTPGIDRVIGVRAGRTEQPGPGDHGIDDSQHLHPSVLRRWDVDPSYRPPNLRKYFALVGDGRANA
jgi:uncharacterized protein (DUF2235 family)